ncbi:MAG: RNA polymerase sigma factor [Anaerolineales bacterium]|nr:RNA polymerase sigma factor [Anaerolineales bacterium]
MTEPLQDRQYVLRLQQGDLSALGVLYDRHRQMVFRTALAITGDPEAAADLLQDVFLRLNRFSRRIDAERPLEPWLYRMTANLCYTWMKRRNRFMRAVTEMAEWISREYHPTPQSITERDEEWDIVRKAVAALPLQQRVVVVMYYINDCAIQEISEILDIPIGTVKSRLYYGRNSLKKQLGLQLDRIPEVNFEYT